MYGLREIVEMNKGDPKHRYRVQRDRLAQALNRVISVAGVLPGDVANLAANALDAAKNDLDIEGVDDEKPFTRYPRRNRNNPPNIRDGSTDDGGAA